MQSTEGNLYNAFSNKNYWKEETEYPLNLNDYESDNITEKDSIEIAKAYAKKIDSSANGRLLTLDEVKNLGGNPDENTTDKCPDFINTTNYWLGTVASEKRYFINLKCLFCPQLDVPVLHGFQI